MATTPSLFPDPTREIFFDLETLRLSHEVEGGWSNIAQFGLAVAVTWDDGMVRHVRGALCAASSQALALAYAVWPDEPIIAAMEENATHQSRSSSTVRLNAPGKTSESSVRQATRRHSRRCRVSTLEDRL